MIMIMFYYIALFFIVFLFSDYMCFTLYVVYIILYQVIL